MYQSPILYNKTVIHSDFLNDDIWNLLDSTFTMPKSFDFKIFEVTHEKYIGRPDLISIDAYGDAIFTDVLCKINGITNPFELNIGTYLIIPSPNDIVNFAHAAPIDEMEGEMQREAPKPKQKNTKRKANEAIVGDKRFKIDAAQGIVIY